MDEIIKTTLLEFEKSAFLIDLATHINGSQYISITQTINNEESERKRAIKLNPSIVKDLVKVLNSYCDLIPTLKNNQQLQENDSYNFLDLKDLNETQKKEIQKRYLNGIPISDLTIQFDCQPELIEQILNNNGIVIMDNQLPKSNKFKRSNRRSRF